MRALLSGALVVLVMGSSGCSEKGQPTAESTTSAETPPSACDLLTEDDAEKLVDEPVDRALVPPYGDEMCIYIPAGADAMQERRPYVGLRLEINVYDTPADLDETVSGERVDDLGRHAVVARSSGEELTISVFVNPNVTFHVWGAGGSLTAGRLSNAARRIVEQITSAGISFEEPAIDPAAGLSCDDWDPASRTGNPPTVGNRVSSFLGHVQEGRDPMITGGERDPFGCAYEELCQAQQARVPESEFRSTRAEAVSRMLSADTWTSARTGDVPEVGVDSQHDDMATLSPELTSAWSDVNATWDEHIEEHTIVSDGGTTERWRVDLVREDGHWRVCDFTQR